MTTVLFWDIDGTLLTTARAGILAWEMALADVLDKTADLSSLDTSGLTDFEIATRLFTRFGETPGRGSAEHLVRQYERHLPDSLPRRLGCVLPGVLAILELMAARSDVHCMLLTGNTLAGANAKLSHYGLAPFFRTGAFADDAADRPSIARAALHRAEMVIGEISPERVFVIGDTPHDIHCGKTIGARTVAVATGSYSLQQLAVHRPWWVTDRLPPPLEFCAKVGIGVPRIN